MRKRAAIDEWEQHRPGLIKKSQPSIPGPVRSTEPLESDTQRACIAEFARVHPRLWRAKRLHAIPNGGYRSPKTAAAMKAEGQVRGVWDLHLTIPRGSYAGLWIESKRRGNGLTEHQKEFRAAHEGEYCFAISHSVEEFMEAVNDYLALPAPFSGINY